MIIIIRDGEGSTISDLRNVIINCDRENNKVYFEFAFSKHTVCWENVNVGLIEDKIASLVDTAISFGKRDVYSILDERSYRFVDK